MNTAATIYFPPQHLGGVVIVAGRHGMSWRAVNKARPTGKQEEPV